MTCLTLAPGAAQADDIYFHKAGATWSQYETDTKACVARTTKSQADTLDNAAATIGGGPLAVAVDTFLTRISATVAARTQHARNLSYCMALRGWTTVNIDDLRDAAGESVDVDRLTDSRITAWFAQPTPPVGAVTMTPDATARVVSVAPAPITLETALSEQTAARGRD